MEKRLLNFAFALAACLFFAGLANANVITIGSTGSPDVFVVGPSGTLLGTTSSTLSGGSFTAPYTESVYRDGGALDATCPTCLDFVINLKDTSGDSLERITIANFGGAGITTDVGYLIGSGGVVPDSVNRAASGSGSLIGFNYTGASGGLQVGQSTPELIIVTNALGFSNGTLSAIDSIPASGPGYGTTVPEPSLAGLLFLGSAGLVAFARRFKKSA